MAERIDKIGMPPVHPGEFLRDEVVEALGLSVSRAAEILGVRRATLSSLLNANASLSPEMALRFEKAFGISMDMMLRMQALYDAETMRAQAGTLNVERYVVADSTRG
jgi:addiction module HigA family antidote